jgi:hypothetical protein
MDWVANTFWRSILWTSAPFTFSKVLKADTKEYSWNLRQCARTLREYKSNPVRNYDEYHDKDINVIIIAHGWFKYHLANLVVICVCIVQSCPTCDEIIRNLPINNSIYITVYWIWPDDVKTKRQLKYLAEMVIRQLIIEIYLKRNSTSNTWAFEQVKSVFY